MARYVALAVLLVAVCCLSAHAQDSDRRESRILTIVDVTSLGPSEVTLLEESAGVIGSCEIGETLLLLRHEAVRFDPPFHLWARRDVKLRDDLSDPMIAIRRGRWSPLDTLSLFIENLYQQGPFSVFQAPAGVVKRLLDKQSSHFQVLSFGRKIVLRRSLRRFSTPLAPPQIPAIRPGPSDAARLKERVTRLESFKTRYSYGPEYLAAAEWASGEFAAMGYRVTRHEYDDYGKKQVNVVAESPSPSTTQGLFIVCGHLDSTSPNARVEAPGADDNGSGSAGVLEIAQLFSGLEAGRSIRYVLFAGEEAGMKGSRAYVRTLKESGELARVRGVVNFDMIGYDAQPPLSAMFETYSSCESFIAPFIAQAKASGAFAPSVSYNPWGSDHMPFLRENVPTFLLIEQEFDDNPNYHRTTDRVPAMNPGLMTAIVDTVAIVLSSLICPPPAR